jgi:hypothetical protein
MSRRHGCVQRSLACRGAAPIRRARGSTRFASGSDTRFKEGKQVWHKHTRLLRTGEYASAR